MIEKRGKFLINIKLISKIQCQEIQFILAICLQMTRKNCSGYNKRTIQLIIILNLLQMTYLLQVFSFLQITKMLKKLINNNLIKRKIKMKKSYKCQKVRKKRGRRVQRFLKKSSKRVMKKMILKNKKFNMIIIEIA